MTRQRKAISRESLDVIALYEVRRGSGEPVITRQETAGMSAAEIKALFRSRVHVEHIVPHALTADDHPSNLRFMAPEDHKPKTVLDVKAIAKSKRVAREHEAFRSRVLAKSTDEVDVAKSASRPKSKLRSRGFQKAPPGHKWFKRGVVDDDVQTDLRRREGDPGFP